jgi:hypothetical protein
MLYVYLISSMHATLPAHLFFLDYITLIICSEEYKLWNFSLCNFLKPHFTSFQYIFISYANIVAEEVFYSCMAAHMELLYFI